MRMSLVATVALLAVGGVALTGVVLAQDRQTVTGPRTVYWMDVSTNSGIAGIDPMQAMMGGGGGGGTTLHLEVASQDPSGRRTEATHTVPAGARIGPELRLEGEDRRGPPPEDGVPEDYEQPRGRLFLFFGCGETAPRGQPVVIDFARVAAGQLPAGLESRVRGAQTPDPPSSRNWPSYAWGPQARGGAFSRGQSTVIPAGGSLVGDHRIQSNFGADIRFSLAAANDLLAPVSFTTNAPAASGAVSLAWNEVPRATAYGLAAMGPGEREGDMVYWTASAVQTWDAGLYGFISPEEAARLVRERVLLAPQTTTCAVPREAAQMMGVGTQRENGGGMVMLTAFGPEANFADPPRPADPRTPWNINWTVKVRTASNTMDMLGQSMSSMMSGGGGASRDPLAETAPPSGMSQRDWCRERAEARAAQAQQSAGSTVGGAIGDAIGVPGAGAAGRALGGLLGRNRNQEPADPLCPS